MSENFEVTYASKTDDDETIVLTSTEIAEKWLSEALQKYDPTNRQYSAILNDKSSQNTVTQDVLDTLAKNPQNDVAKIKQINSIVKYYINSDDIIGKVAETIENRKKAYLEEGRKPYFIMGGGHGNCGTAAYVKAYNEILEYQIKNGISFDYIFHASGTERHRQA